MIEHYIRIGICAIAVLWAIVRVHQTGNYARIRLYLYAVLADVLVLGAYGLRVGFSGFGYEVAYTVSYTLLGILAILAARSAARSIPTAVAAFVTNAAVIASLFAWQQSNKSTVALLTILQAGIFFVAGITALAASNANPVYRAPMRTLGSLWITQMGFCYLYAAGVSLARTEWEAIGDWMPTLIAVAALVKLGFDFKHEAHARLEPQTQ